MTPRLLTLPLLCCPLLHPLAASSPFSNPLLINPPRKENLDLTRLEPRAFPPLFWTHIKQYEISARLVIGLNVCTPSVLFKRAFMQFMHSSEWGYYFGPQCNAGVVSGREVMFTLPFVHPSCVLALLSHFVALESKAMQWRSRRNGLIVLMCRLNESSCRLYTLLLHAPPRRALSLSNL